MQIGDKVSCPQGEGEIVDIELPSYERSRRYAVKLITFRTHTDEANFSGNNVILYFEHELERI